MIVQRALLIVLKETSVALTKVLLHYGGWLPNRKIEPELLYAFLDDGIDVKRADASSSAAT
jgi:hypothetical protein